MSTTDLPPPPLSKRRRRELEQDQREIAISKAREALEEAKYLGINLNPAESVLFEHIIRDKLLE